MKYMNHIRIRIKYPRRVKIGITHRPTFLGKIKFCGGTARNKKFLKTIFFLGLGRECVVVPCGSCGQTIKKKGRNAHAHVPMKLPYRLFSCSHEVPSRSRACSPPPRSCFFALAATSVAAGCCCLCSPSFVASLFCVLRGPSPSSAAGPISSLFLSPLLFSSSSSSQPPPPHTLLLLAGFARVLVFCV